MRQRNKPWAHEMMEQYPQYMVLKPEEQKGKWHALFGNNNPIHIEVGTGKGQFITGMAMKNPQINYIAIEVSKNVLVNALEKVIQNEISNIKLMLVDAENLPNIFTEGEVALVYLNFSDPWPKTRHEKRRLTYKSFLDLYKSILPKNGEIHFKTDNRGLFEFSLVSFNQYGMDFKFVSLDLHNSDYEGNIMTEYEAKFSAKGNPIYRCEVAFK
ncbi:MAG: trmB [Bacillales bacterium]|jgi:tRNA (guanine-N7-)-methyltransferase|nr:trmB [Bacillales bacterium]